MKGVRTTKAFFNSLNDEFVWRRMEIVDARLDVKSISEIKNHRTRAGVTLTYAHWEGFVKAATELLLNFITHQGVLNRDLNEIFLLFSLRTQVGKIVTTNKLDASLDAVNFLVKSMDSPCRISYKNSIDTGSNLSSAVFDNIAKSIGVDVKPYQYLYPYIDESFVNRRNTIAHGEPLSISREEFYSMTEKVIELMSMYKTDIENIVTLKSYQRS